MRPPCCSMIRSQTARPMPDPGIGLLAVQPPERLEDALRVRRVHADPVVAHREAPHRAIALGVDADLGVLAARELHGVADEVLKDATEVRSIGEHDGKRPYPHARPAAFDRARKRLERLRDGEPRAQRVGIEVPAPGARVLEQVADQGARLRRRAADAVDQVVTVLRPGAVAALEQLGVHRDRRQRRLQVVRGHRRELLELGVGAQQLGVRSLELGLAALERVGHRVEAARELADLVVAVGRHARGEIAGRKLLGRLRDGHDRAHDRAPQVQRAARDDDEHEPEPADPEADRQRGLRLGGILALGHERALARGELAQRLAQRRHALARGGIEEPAAGAHGVLPGVADHALRGRAVGVDLGADLAHAGTLTGIVGELALERGLLPGVVLEALDQRRHRAIGVTDVLAQAVLDREQRRLQARRQRQRLLGAKRDPRCVALVHDGDDQQHERRTEQHGDRGAQRQHPRRHPCPEASSQHVVAELSRGPHNCTRARGALARSVRLSATGVRPAVLRRPRSVSRITVCPRPS